MTVGRDITQFIDIHDTSNEHIEIDDRKRSIHDYPRGWEQEVTILNSVTSTTHQKSTTLEGHTKKVTCTFFGHWNSRDEYKVFPHKRIFVSWASYKWLLRSITVPKYWLFSIKKHIRGTLRIKNSFKFCITVFGIYLPR